jgi:hypothetical protein
VKSTSLTATFAPHAFRSFRVTSRSLMPAASAAGAW